MLEEFIHLILPSIIAIIELIGIFVVAVSAALWVLSQPAFAVLLAVSLFFWVIAYRRPPVAGRFTA